MRRAGFLSQTTMTRSLSFDSDPIGHQNGKSAKAFMAQTDWRSIQRYFRSIQPVAPARPHRARRRRGLAVWKASQLRSSDADRMAGAEGGAQFLALAPFPARSLRDRSHSR